ncbi:MAG: hypothetical protein ACJ79S_22435 [Gemmatimonadaceae bacterium]
MSAPDGETGPPPRVALSAAERARLDPRVRLEPLERLLAAVPEGERAFLLGLCAAEPDLEATLDWVRRTADDLTDEDLRDLERAVRGTASGSRICPQLSDVQFSDPALQRLLEAAFPTPPPPGAGE